MKSNNNFQIAENVVWVPIGRLLDNPLNVYLREQITEESCQELAVSVKEKGITVPLLITPYRDAFRIVHGHRRRIAGRMAALTELPCIIKTGLDQDQQFDLMLNENIQRQDITLLAQARCYHKLVSEGKSVADIERKTGVPTQRIKTLLIIVTLEPEVQDFFERGKLQTGAAQHIAKLTDPQARLYLARAAVKNQWSIPTIETKAAQWGGMQEAVGDESGKRKHRASKPFGSLINEDGSRLTKSESLARFRPTDTFTVIDIKRAILSSCCDQCEEQRFPDICRECPVTQMLATLLDVKGLRHLPDPEAETKPANDRVN